MTYLSAGLPSPGALQSIEPKNVHLIPKGLIRGATAEALVKAGHALPMMGIGFAFTSVEVVLRTAGSVERHAAAVVAFEPWRHVLPGAHKHHLENVVQTIAAARPAFAELDLNATKIMGIVNVTPDSFSDGGDLGTTQAAIDHAIALREAGADILDVGGESTRPGAEPVSPDVEQGRVIPVIGALADRGLKVSVDTRHASTMAAALEAGASIVNDVTALTGDPEALSVVAKYRAPVILMHMQGQPQTMQAEPAYQWAPVDVYRMLNARVEACEEAGISRSNISVDPGIGFGKTDDHNLALIDSLAVLQGLGCSITFGASRKSFIGRLANEPSPKKRLAGSITAAMKATEQGAHILRVHDVSETRQALAISQV